MPLLLSQKLLRLTAFSVEESSSKTNPKRRIDDGDRRPSTSNSDKSKNHNFVERKGEGGFGGDKRQRTAPLVPEDGVDRPVLKPPTSSSNNVEDGELSD